MMSKEELTLALENANIREDALFSTLLSESIALLSLSDRDIAHRFSVSRPTLDRWKSGANAPHPVMRTPVYAWLLDLVKNYTPQGTT